MKQEEARLESKPVNKGMLENLKEFFSAESTGEERLLDAKLVEHLDRICVQLSCIFDVRSLLHFSLPLSIALNKENIVLNMLHF